MTVKEFYEWCVENKNEDYTLVCYGITKWGDVSYSTDLKSKMIHSNPKYKKITLYDEDDLEWTIR